MHCITIRFYGELNDFLPPDKRQQSFCYWFDGQPAVKDLIESLGIPHPEVDLILVNGDSAAFSRQVQGGERVAVYPVFKKIDIAGTTRVRPEPPADIRFVLDCHLGKLATYLRMLGFDCLFSRDATDGELASISADQQRVLLTRDRGLLKRGKVAHGYCLRSLDPVSQLTEILNRFGLLDRFHPFARCIRCNDVLRPVPKEEIWSCLPEKVREYCHEFHRCPGCGRIYWRGTHYEHMRDFIRSLR